MPLLLQCYLAKRESALETAPDAPSVFVRPIASLHLANGSSEFLPCQQPAQLLGGETHYGRCEHPGLLRSRYYRYRQTRLVSPPLDCKQTSLELSAAHEAKCPSFFPRVQSCRTMVHDGHSGAWLPLGHLEAGV